MWLQKGHICQVAKLTGAQCFKLFVSHSSKQAFPNYILIQARSQPDFSAKPGGPFCLSCTFIFRNERNWKKSARVSENLVSPGLPGLQVAKRL